MSEITIMRGSQGLNTRVDSTRIRFDPETGVQDLAIARDVNIDATGRISRRKGFARKLSVSGAHSVFGYKDTCLCVIGTVLYTLASDLSGYVSLRTGLTSDARMSYAGVNNDIFYANGFENGVVTNGSNADWSSTTEPSGYRNITRDLSAPPIGNILGYHAGRILIAVGQWLFYTEPLAYYWCDLGSNFIGFPNTITMAVSVGDGMFIGTEEETYFVRGTSPNEYLMERVADYGVYPHTAVKMDTSILPGEMVTGKDTWIWTSSKGICLGTTEGQFLNLTRKRIDMIGAVRGAGLLVDNRYIVALE